MPFLLYRTGKRQLPAVAEPNTTSLTRRDYQLALLFFALILTANLIRLNYWSPLPDEINYARCARSLIDNRTIISNDIMFFPPLFVYLSALLQLLGMELLTSVRLISALTGAAILPVLYLTARLLYPPATALPTLLLTLPLFSLRLYSRLGQVEITMLFFIILSILFLLRALRSGKGSDAIRAGVILGLGLWTKETALGATAVAVIFILTSSQSRWQMLGKFLLGLAPPALLLFILSIFTGRNLLFEIMASRGYDINMLQLNPLGNLIALGANLGYNLVPRLFYPWEILIFILLVPAVSILLLIALIKGVKDKNPFSRLVLIYLIVHLPFFFFFSRKFDYYLLPTALLVLFNGGLTLLAAGTGRTLRRTGLCLLTLLCLDNLYAGYFLYCNRGTHASFEEAVGQIEPNTTVATSHLTLVEYLARRAGRQLQVRELFEPGTYRLHSGVLADSTIGAILLKYYYYQRLISLYPQDWERLQALFPLKMELIDYHWSPPSRHFPIKLKGITEFAKPIGVVILRRPD
ncbi:MAG: glycosyltransferase family 39 protein [candidate division WOR-3 bacterium]